MVMMERGSPDTALGRCRDMRAGGFSCAPWRVAETVETWAIPLLSEFPAVGAVDGHGRARVARHSPGPLPLHACWRIQLCSLAGRRDCSRPTGPAHSQSGVRVRGDGSWNTVERVSSLGLGRGWSDAQAAGRVITNSSADTCESPIAMCRVSPGPELVEVKDVP